MSEYAVTNYPQAPQVADAPQTTREYAAAIGANVPADHQAAADRVVTINFKGEQFRLDMGRFTFGVQYAFERQQILTGLEKLFGPEQFEKMTDWDLEQDLPALLQVIKETRQAGK